MAIVAEFLVLSVILNSITALAFSTRPVMAWFSRNQSQIRIAFGLKYFGLGLPVIRGVVIPASQAD